MHYQIISLRERMLRAAPKRLVLVAAAGMLQGCKLLTFTTVVAAGAVGLVGYGVYKVGETAVTGAGSAVSSVAGGIGSATSEIFADGDFQATCPGSMNAVWTTSAMVLQSSGFKSVSGDRDALSGHLEATTSDNQPITIKLDSAGQGQIALRLRVGARGDLGKSETLYQMIAADLARQRQAQRQGGV